MPGYRALSTAFTGTAADSAREAESLRQDGQTETAVRLLEQALAASLQTTQELPGWLCGRLAALYRTLQRYDDEVALLERYRESQTSEEARTRYDARLSKARTIADRKRRPDSGALLSVRKVLGTPRRRPTSKGSPEIPPPPAEQGPCAECVLMLAALLAIPGSSEVDAQLDLLMARYVATARASGIPVERLVDGLRAASREGMASAVNDAEREERYSGALVRLLAAYFEDRDR